ncbi:MAG: hypothetical protein HY275_15350 [Gemmatimonadetes bacterium]|nr:hypothetical protein [Gemmatimonadota bacterium]
MKLSARPSASAALSVAIHAAIIGAALRWAVLGYPLPTWMVSKGDEPVQQRITYLRTGGGSGPVARASNVAAGAAKKGKAAEEKRLIAPVEVPNGIAAAPAAPVAEEGGANAKESGTGAGGSAMSGAIEGMRPALTDGRLYGPPPRGLGGPEPLTGKQRADSVIGEAFGRYRDSITAVQMANAGKRDPRDWTYKDKSGRQWGMDPSYIRLGPVSIPTALLALLPLNSNAPSPSMYESRRIAQLSQEIQFNVSRAMTQEDFNAAVRRTRERKDRERSEQMKKKGSDVPVYPAVQPAVATP